MYKSKYKNMVVAIILWGLLISNLAYAESTHLSIHISSEKDTIAISEPLIFKMTYRFDRPQISTRTGKILDAVLPQAMVLIEIKDKDFVWLSRSTYVDENTIFVDDKKNKYYRYPIEGTGLVLQDDSGVIYSGYFSLFHNRAKPGLIFDTTDTYTIMVVMDKVFSNELSIQVVDKQDKDIKHCILSDPNDYVFLIAGDSQIFCNQTYRSRISSRLKTLIGHNPNAILSQWASCRIGLEYFKEFDKKHGDFEKFKKKYKAGEIQEPLLDQAITYMNIGLQLPEDFPLRQELLHNLSMLEYIKDNYDRSFSLLDELKNKYPKSKYGRQAEGTKQELLKMQQREKE